MGENQHMWKRMLVLALSGLILLTSCVFNTQVSTTEEVPSSLEETLPPEVMAEIQNKVSQKLDVALEQIQIQSIQKISWPNACLGLPEVDEVCAETVTPGWVVKLVIADNEYNFHVDEEGVNIRQEP
jgi:hypothetical protein